ncbi:MAG TPA: hypothetical protein VL633_05900 [Bacteroidota bacterium]|nr:hypothetical protein [Bacteroidota bacterium]
MPMTIKKYLRRALFAIPAVAGFLSLSCNEKLPVYVAPTNILSLYVSKVEQLNDRQAPPGHQAVHIQLTGENIFDEVFQDSVDIKGSLRIWWKRKPDRFRTMYLTLQNFTSRDLIHSGRMLLLPGQRFTVDAIWDLKTDDSIYVAHPNEMNYTYPDERICDYNIVCSDPEGFVVESSLNVYDRLGYIVASPKDFTVIGHICYLCGRGPSCPPPPGGCSGSQQP